MIGTGDNAIIVTRKWNVIHLKLIAAQLTKVHWYVSCCLMERITSDKFNTLQTQAANVDTEW
jgi:hypothetical protein